MRNLLVLSTIIVSGMFALVLGLYAATSGKSPAGPPEDQRDEYRVKIDNFSFMPASMTVPAGTTVTWVNRDDVPHNVVSTEKKFKSPVLDTDEQFSYKFTDPGAYEYFCSIHPKMTGKIVVQ